MQSVLSLYLLQLQKRDLSQKHWDPYTNIEILTQSITQQISKLNLLHIYHNVTLMSLLCDGQHDRITRAEWQSSNAKAMDIHRTYIHTVIQCHVLSCIACVKMEHHQHLQSFNRPGPTNSSRQSCLDTAWSTELLILSDTHDQTGRFMVVFQSCSCATTESRFHLNGKPFLYLCHYLPDTLGLMSWSPNSLNCWQVACTSFVMLDLTIIWSSSGSWLSHEKRSQLWQQKISVSVTGLSLFFSSIRSWSPASRSPAHEA